MPQQKLKQTLKRGRIIRSGSKGKHKQWASGVCVELRINGKRWQSAQTVRVNLFSATTMALWRCSAGKQQLDKFICHAIWVLRRGSDNGCHSSSGNNSNCSKASRMHANQATVIVYEQAYISTHMQFFILESLWVCVLSVSFSLTSLWHCSSAAENELSVVLHAT